MNRTPLRTSPRLRSGSLSASSTSRRKKVFAPKDLPLSPVDLSNRCRRNSRSNNNLFLENDSIYEKEEDISPKNRSNDTKRRVLCETDAINDGFGTAEDLKTELQLARLGLNKSTINQILNSNDFKYIQQQPKRKRFKGPQADINNAGYLKSYESWKNRKASSFQLNRTDEYNLNIGNGLFSFNGFSVKDTLSPPQPSHELNTLIYSPFIGPCKMNVTEIAVYGDYVFCLMQNGLGVVYNRLSLKCLKILNTLSCDQIIRSFFVNKLNNDLILVSVYSFEKCTDLYCTAHNLENLTSNECKRLFSSEILSYPGFVEFDEVNYKVLTFNAKDSKYKIWSMKTYDLLYSLRGDSMSEAKISPGVLLIINEQVDETLPLHIMDIQTGEILQKLVYNLKGPLEFVDLFVGKILLKEEDANLAIIDIKTGKKVSVNQTKKVKPAGFMFLYNTNLFLSFEMNKVSVWDFNGKKISTCNSSFSLQSLCVSQDQRFLFSFNKDEIAITEIAATKVISTLTSNPGKKVKRKFNNNNLFGGELLMAKKTREQALNSVTTMYYNDDTGELFTGSESGDIFIWGL